MMMKSVFWWRKPECPEETTGLRQVMSNIECFTYNILLYIVWAFMGDMSCLDENSVYTSFDKIVLL